MKHARDVDEPGLRILVVERPRCIHCASPRLRLRRTIDQGDGSILRYCHCEECGQPSKVVLE